MMRYTIVYFLSLHSSKPYASARGSFKRPFYERDKALSAYFLELSGWERAHQSATLCTPRCAP